MSTEKHYAGDWAKAKSRDLVRGMVERTLLTFRKPQDISVLCFPGIDAAEVTEVYDPLGIPRENIVGLERDPEIAEQIEANCPGIQVVNQSLDDYIAGLGGHNFGVISLDYTGGLSFDQIDCLTSLVKKQGRDNFVLHVANLIKRDPQARDIYHGVSGFSRICEEDQRSNPTSVTLTNAPEVTERIFGPSSSYGQAVDDFDQRARAKSNLSEDKKKSYSLLLRSTVAAGDLETGVVDIFNFFADKTAIEEARKLEESAFGEVTSEEQFDARNLFLLSRMSSQGVGAKLSYSLQGITWNAIQRACLRNSIRDVSEHMVVLNAITEANKAYKFFKEIDARTYSYISESGAPMVGDVYFLAHPREVVKAARNIAQATGFPKNLRVRNRSALSGLIRKYVKASGKFRGKKTLSKLKKEYAEREFLGSSAKPVLTKAKALEELDDGLTTDQIREKYRGPKLKSLAAWKAWQTMRANGTKEPTLEETIETNGDIETITKEDAINLLSEGIPLKEIHEAYPTSFKPAQLRAFKAHITMGTYPETSQ
ncbi:hypothetical protein HOF78_01880 [Candidatus Woesearchaeota archaeon]|jgi:hypothetical protein|nr:hypothetical protein [Candidatus Woesearchaeota archaeon]